MSPDTAGLPSVLGDDQADHGQRSSNRIEGRAVFVAGAGTHPGAGLPGVISSARVLDRLIPAIGTPALQHST